MYNLKSIISLYWKLVLFYAIPVALCPLIIFLEGKEIRAVFILLIMGSFWCSEILPLGITAIIPVVLAPIFGIMSIEEVCSSYFQPLGMLTFGVLVFGIANEKTKLSERIALKMILRIGTNTKWLMMGVMLPTWFMSMWINNTATTAIMMPIAFEISQKLNDIENADKGFKTIESSRESNRESSGSNEEAILSSHKLKKIIRFAKDYQLEEFEFDTVSLESDPDAGDIIKVIPSVDKFPSSQRSTLSSWNSLDQQVSINRCIFQDQDEVMFEEEEKLQNQPDEIESPASVNIEKALIICIAYAANIGGTANLFGTSVNVVLKDNADRYWEKHNFEHSPINYKSWFVIGMPLSLINLLLAWLWLEIYFIGYKNFLGGSESRKEELMKRRIFKILEYQYRRMGKLKLDEILIIIIFIILVVSWLTHSDHVFSGWSSFYPNKFTGDAIPAIAVVILLFIIPRRWPFGENNEPKNVQMLIDWKELCNEVPWSIILLLGGSFALARTVQMSGLSLVIGSYLKAFKNLPQWIILFVMGLGTSIITEFTTNVACASFLLPIAISLAEHAHMNPLNLMFIITISSQFAFMLPVATSPNAIAYSRGKLDVIDMVKAGIILNILCLFVAVILLSTLGSYYFNLNELPFEV